jgi:hypothetical protein
MGTEVGSILDTLLWQRTVDRQFPRFNLRPPEPVIDAAPQSAGSDRNKPTLQCAPVKATVVLGICNGAPAASGSSRTQPPPLTSEYLFLVDRFRSLVSLVPARSIESSATGSYWARPPLGRLLACIPYHVHLRTYSTNSPVWSS